VIKSLYLINPRTEIPGYFGADVFEAWGFRPGAATADLATATVAALAPQDWKISICEEHVEAVDFDTDVDFVALTGKISQAPRLIRIADEFRRRGKIVIIGGPYASLSPAAVRGHCDVLMIGELEGIASQLFGDLERGKWQSEYHGGKPDLTTSPLPRWDLYPNERALLGCVQTSRGCPFECEFCDVIPYLGRRQRHKPAAAVLAELDKLYALGYRSVFLADDNFTASRPRARELLASLREWNQQLTDGHVSFCTQLSIDAARDRELVRLCAQAGVNWVFIGLETPNQASLRECRKRQNVGVDLIEQVQVFLEHGISVAGGMMVGFDHDGPDIFERQYEFAMASPIPIFSIGALVAPAATPLFRRLQAANRLIDGGAEIAATPWTTNVIPALMGREQLLDGLRSLCNRLYSPAAFKHRLIGMIDCIGPHPVSFRTAIGSTPRRIETEAALLINKIAKLGEEERRMLNAVLLAVARKPQAAQAVMMALFRYAQLRCLYEIDGFWTPVPAAAAAVRRTAAAATLMGRLG
jgi:hypothetical protein